MTVPNKRKAVDRIEVQKQINDRRCQQSNLKLIEHTATKVFVLGNKHASSQYTQEEQTLTRTQEELQNAIRDI